jgi:4-amino-4-deoxy-L-arabinose transferase-like glycosyltransferase
MRWSDRHWLIPILAGYLLLGALYAVYTPAWQAPDEPAHYNYVRQLAEGGDFPVMRPGDYPAAYLEQLKAARFPSNMPVDSLRYEGWQPPLYYVLAAPVYRLSGGALLPLRLFSLILGAGTVLMAYAIGRTVYPGDHLLALGAAAFVAFLPMHLAIVASVNNDGLTELLVAGVALRLLGWVRPSSPGPAALDGLGRPEAGAALRRPGQSVRRLLVTGFLLGLGLATKASVYYIALPLALAALWLAERRPRQLLSQGAALLTPAVLVVAPWAVRNLTVYGWPDLLGKLNHDRVVVGQLRTADYLSQVGWPAYLADFVTTTFRSFWGQFGWMGVPMDRRLYAGLGVLSVLAVAGCALLAWRGPATRNGGRTPSRPTHYATILLVLWLALAVGGYLYYNISFVQFQGRYLFPALVPIGLLMVAGWEALLSRRWSVAGAGVSGLIAAGGVLSSSWTGSPDKWLIGAGAGTTLALTLRRWLPASWDGWLIVMILIGLAGLAAFSLFAFVVPNL